MPTTPHVMLHRISLLILDYARVVFTSEFVDEILKCEIKAAFLGSTILWCFLLHHPGFFEAVDVITPDSLYYIPHYLMLLCLLWTRKTEKKKKEFFLPPYNHLACMSRHLVTGRNMAAFAGLQPEDSRRVFWEQIFKCSFRPSIPGSI